MLIRTVDDKIREQQEKSLELKKLSVGNDKVSFEKSKELQNQQKEEWQKLVFFKNLRREMMNK